MLKLGVSYYGNRIPWRVREDLKTIKEAGCTYVVHTFSEEDFEFYQPAMNEIIQISHELGLEVWLDPWGVGQVFGGETYSSLVMKNLSIRQVSSTGEILPAACLNQPVFRDYLLKWIRTAKKLNADVLFWDEPHFFIYPEPEGDSLPKLWACRCDACRSLFQKLYGGPMSQIMTKEVRLFKENGVVSFSKFLCDATVQEGLRAALCVLPFENSSTVNKWEEIAAIPSLSIIGTDPYWRPHESNVKGYVGRFAQRIAALAQQYNKEGQIWILNFNIPKGEEPKIQEAIEAGYAQGIRNFAAWSYLEPLTSICGRTIRKRSGKH